MLVFYSCTKNISLDVRIRILHRSLPSTIVNAAPECRVSSTFKVRDRFIVTIAALLITLRMAVLPPSAQTPSLSAPRAPPEPRPGGRPAALQPARLATARVSHLAPRAFLAAAAAGSRPGLCPVS